MLAPSSRSMYEAGSVPDAVDAPAGPPPALPAAETSLEAPRPAPQETPPETIDPLLAMAELVPLPARPRSMGWRTFFQDSERWRADPELAHELADLLPDTTDDLPLA